MKLHAANLAITAGAKGEEIEKVTEKLCEEGKYSAENAKRILGEIRGE
jgi:hydroxymethylglutaryl-CoA reductase